MPVYEYRCEACDQECESYVSTSEDRQRPGVACPCGGTLRLAGLSAPAVGRPEFFGFRDASGRDVKASLWRDGPKKRPGRRVM